MPTLSPPQQQALQQLVIDVFNQGELEELTRYRLGRRLDVLVTLPQTFDRVVFQLIEFVERHGWTEEFIRGVYEARKEKEQVVTFCRANAAYVFAPASSNKDLAQAVSTGLTTVFDKMAVDGGGVRAVLVNQADQNLADLGVQFNRLRRYKMLHGCLHNLQFKYARLIKSEIRVWREDAGAADNLRTYFHEMNDELVKARPGIDGLESRAAEQMWLNVAEESVRRMGAAVDANKPDDAPKGYQLLEGVLRVQPTRINELLTGLLERLQLERLRAALLAVQAPLAAEAAPLVHAASALGSLSPRLNGILANHKEWQLVDNSLQQIDTELKLGAAPEQCAFLWSEVLKVLEPLLDQDKSAAWSRELRQLGSDLTVALASSDVPRVRAAFNRLHPRAMWFFFTADENLKALSEELDKVGDKLRDILAMVAHA